MVVTIFSISYLRATAPSGIYTLSLHDALPIYVAARQPVAVAAERHLAGQQVDVPEQDGMLPGAADAQIDRKSTRLNSSHGSISYAVFCLKKKKESDVII